MSLYKNETTNFKIFLTVATGKLASSSITATALPHKIRSTANSSLTTTEKAFLTNRSIAIPTDGLITRSYTPSISTTTENSGEVTEVKTHAISGVINFKNENIIARVVVTAKTGQSFINSPFISYSNAIRGIIDNNISLTARNVSKTLDSSKNITACTFDLVLHSSHSIPSTNNNFYYNVNLPLYDQRPETPTSIDSVSFGKNTFVNFNGEDKKIRIYGKEGASFTYMINNENRESVLKPKYRGGGSPTVFKNKLTHPTNFTDGDFIEARGSEGFDSSPKVTDRFGFSVRSIQDVIPKIGYFEIIQNFPKAKVVKTTKTNGTFTNTRKIIFDDLTDVKVGDVLLMTEVNEASTCKVITLNPDSDNANECLLSEGFTTGDDAVATFVRGDTFNIDILTSDTLGSLMPTVSPMYTLNQNSNPTITVRFTTSTLHYSINTKAIPGSGTQQFDFNITGRPNASPGKLESEGVKTTKGEQDLGFSKNITTVQPVNRILLFLDASAASRAFTLIKTPVYSTNEIISDFTNTGDSNTSGNDFSIKVISATVSDHGGVTNGKLVILFDLLINQFGNEDVIVGLNLDNICSTS